MALAVLCVSALAQENTTDYWVTKAKDLIMNGSTDEAIDLSPIYSNAWAGRGEAQKSMGLVTEASASFYVARKLGYQE
jgi:hypothetical protein